MYKQELINSQEDKLSYKFESLYPLLYITAMMGDDTFANKKSPPSLKTHRFSEDDSVEPFIISDIKITPAKAKRVKC
jgi:hypothetical protein